MMQRFIPGVIVAALMTLGCDSSAPPSAAPQTTPVAHAPGSPKTERPASQPEPPFVLEDGFRMLALSDFEAFEGQPETWTSLEHGLRCSGKPRGYLYSKENFQNFTWKLEYRFPRPANVDESKFAGNTGFLVYITGEHKVWPLCLEVQGKFTEMGMIKENGGAQAPDVIDVPATRDQYRKPVGEWNELEITSQDGSLIVMLNGTLVASSQPAFLSSGAIGIQAENHNFTVRRMRIRVDQ